jgi:hypothetical protein
VTKKKKKKKKKAFPRQRLTEKKKKKKKKKKKTLLVANLYREPNTCQMAPYRKCQWFEIDWRHCATLW